MLVFLVGLQSGIALAAIYVLIAVSFALVIAVSGVFNFVQGSVVMLTTLASYMFVKESGWSSYAALPVVLVLGLVGGALTYLVAVRPTLSRAKSLMETGLLTTIGASTAINAIAAVKFGSDARPVPGYVTGTPFHVGSVPIRPVYVVITVVAIGVVAAVMVVLAKTNIGHVTRATLEDAEGARILGIATDRVTFAAFAVAGVIAALAGWLIAPVIGASAFSAQELAFYAFAAMAIGGFGSFSGAMAGGVVVGLTSGLVPTYAQPEWANIAILALVICTLVIRPAGLLGTAGLFGSKSVREI